MTPTSATMSAAGVKPTSLPISELLSSRYPAYVPKYQRAYAWQDDQVTDLIDDVKLLLSAERGERGHFYGGMVAIKVSDSSEPTSNTYEIVDGQQRLATFCLLLAQIALRAQELSNAARAQDEDTEEAIKFSILAKEVRDAYLYYQRYNVDKGSQSTEPRVRLSRADDEIFQDLLKGAPVTQTRESHRLLVQSADLLRNELVLPASPEDCLADARKNLQRLRDTVLRDSFVIHIVSDSRPIGYRLFAVLNDRGARLTVADLLRNHTLELLDARAGLLDNAARRWDEILTQGAELVDDFLMAYYTSLTGRRTKPSDLFDDIKKLLFPRVRPPEELLSALSQMAIELDAFQAIHAGTWPYNAADRVPTVTDWQRSRLARLVLTLRHELSTPLLLAARECCTEEQFAELVHMIEMFAFRYKNVCGAHAGPASASYYAECKRLRALQSTASLDFDTLRKALRNLITKRAPDISFRNAIREKLKYDRGSAARTNLRYFLTVIEDYRPWIKQGAVGEPTPSMISVTDIAQATIEHICPEHSASPVPALDPYVNDLGNLSYWAPNDNSAAGNAPFEDKLQAYRASSVSLNNDLTRMEKWTPATLKERESQLTREACLIFRV